MAKKLKLGVGTKFIIFFILLQIIVGIPFYLSTLFYIKNSLEREKKNQLVSFASVVATAAQPAFLDGDLTVLQEQVGRFVDNDKTGEALFVGIYDKDGRALATKASSSSIQPVSDSAKDPPGILMVSSFIVHNGQELGRVDVYSTQHRITYIVIRQAGLILIFLCILFILMTTPLTAKVVSSWIIKPVIQLSQGAHKISEGDLDLRVDIGSKDEIGDLAEAFNSMAVRLKIREDDLSRATEQLQSSHKKLKSAYARLKELDSMKSEFIAIASHELRTPLTVLKVYIETFLMGRFGELKKEQKEKLQVVERSLNRFIRIVDDLFDLSRLERGEIKLKKEPVAIGKVITETVQEFSLVAKKKDLTLVADAPNGLPLITGDAQRLHQVFGNLLSNAVKFTPAGGNISIKARKTQEAIEVSVSDTGIGIEEKDIPMLFTPFHQIGQVEESEFRGSGLGLAVTKKIVVGHGGKVKVISRKGEGSTFVCIFPMAEKDRN